MGQGSTVQERALIVPCRSRCSRPLRFRYQQRLYSSAFESRDRWPRVPHRRKRFHPQRFVFSGNLSSPIRQGAVQFVCEKDAVNQMLLRLSVSPAGVLRPFEALLRVQVTNGAPVDENLIDLRERPGQQVCPPTPLAAAFRPAPHTAEPLRRAALRCPFRSGRHRELPSLGAGWLHVRPRPRQTGVRWSGR